MHVRDETSRADLDAVQRVSGVKTAKRAAVRGRMSRTDFQDGSARKGNCITECPLTGVRFVRAMGATLIAP